MKRGDLYIEWEPDIKVPGFMLTKGKVGMVLSPAELRWLAQAAGPLLASPPPAEFKAATGRAKETHEAAKQLQRMRRA